jgi:tRNA G18 (ribose-2'-O)-methylase SpoU
VPFARIDNWPGELARLGARGFALVALTPRQPALTLDEFLLGPQPARRVLLVGAEGVGLTAAAEGMADYRVRIPIHPEIDSLNLSVATGIALSRLSRLTNLADLA